MIGATRMALLQMLACHVGCLVAGQTHGTARAV
jgi:hypothetical protein